MGSASDRSLGRLAIAASWLGLFAPFVGAQVGGTSSTAIPPVNQLTNHAAFAPFAGAVTPEAAMMRGDTAATSLGWTVEPLLTIGESLGAYQPPGRLDGIGAFQRPGGRGLVLINSELGSNRGYAYTLANGTVLKGARVSRLVVERDASTGNSLVGVASAGVAYHTIYDRAGQVVVHPSQVNEAGDGINGLSRLCSARGVAIGERGFVDEIFFTGEEGATGNVGSEWALDVRARELWAVPAVGRGAWENVTPLDTADSNKVALLMGNDSAGAALFLYIGIKESIGDGSFLDRNGLAVGTLYAWRADSGDLNPQSFNGVDASRTGAWVEVTVRDAALAGQPGYDSLGYAGTETLLAEAAALGCFSFSRPEDAATNPNDGTQAVFASTGRGGLFPADNWGTVYLVEVDFTALQATVTILHDADGLAVPDSGIRSPDNLDWAPDGMLYVQEDRATDPPFLFGSATGVEASLWQLDPVSRAFERIAEVDRAAVAPAGATDICTGDIGCWETTGVLDVTEIFDTLPGERLLISAIQPHGIQDGPIGGRSLLVEGGQLFFVSKVGP